METSSGGRLTREVPVFSPDELLSKTSRTFALAIPYLPEPTRREVSIAYLLLRIGDTLEDGTRWAAARRATELLCYSSLLRRPSPEAARALASRWLRDQSWAQLSHIRAMKGR